MKHRAVSAIVKGMIKAQVTSATIYERRALKINGIKRNGNSQKKVVYENKNSRMEANNKINDFSRKSLSS